MGRLVKPMSQQEYENLSALGRWWQRQGPWIMVAVLVLMVLFAWWAGRQ